MIKGVNKQILEVTNTESKYFERIIFFVRPESQHLGEYKLQSEAVKLSKQSVKPPRVRKNPRQIMMSAVYGVLGAGAGVALMFVINYFV